MLATPNDNIASQAQEDGELARYAAGAQELADGGAVTYGDWEPLKGGLDIYNQAARQRAVYGQAGDGVPAVGDVEMANRPAPDTTDATAQTGGNQPKALPAPVPRQEESTQVAGRLMPMQRAAADPRFNGVMEDGVFLDPMGRRDQDPSGPDQSGARPPIRDNGPALARQGRMDAVYPALVNDIYRATARAAPVATPQQRAATLTSEQAQMRLGSSPAAGATPTVTSAAPPGARPISRGPARVWGVDVAPSVAPDAFTGGGAYSAAAVPQDLGAEFQKRGMAQADQTSQRNLAQAAASPAFARQREALSQTAQASGASPLVLAPAAVGAAPGPDAAAPTGSPVLETLAANPAPTSVNPTSTGVLGRIQQTGQQTWRTPAPNPDKGPTVGNVLALSRLGRVPTRAAARAEPSEFTVETSPASQAAYERQLTAAGGEARKVGGLTQYVMNREAPVTASDLGRQVGQGGTPPEAKGAANIARVTAPGYKTSGAGMFSPQDTLPAARADASLALARQWNSLTPDEQGRRPDAVSDALGQSRVGAVAPTVEERRLALDTAKAGAELADRQAGRTATSQGASLSRVHAERMKAMEISLGYNKDQRAAAAAWDTDYRAALDEGDKVKAADGNMTGQGAAPPLAPEQRDFALLHGGLIKRAYMAGGMNPDTNLVAGGVREAARILVPPDRALAETMKRLGLKESNDQARTEAAALVDKSRQEAKVRVEQMFFQQRS
ncbi:hypothetical protein [uncultured Thiodictyon sp.]|uniref:hypothetical protein n=1 Tax=uncultured Thiodictyon sp. TaxID=1846217 RepID=UPI0025FE4FE3|nr:hypothetical protein [uncultured Thiodictyon sp.]